MCAREASVDMDMDGKFHIHGKPVPFIRKNRWTTRQIKQADKLQHATTFADDRLTSHYIFACLQSLTISIHFRFCCSTGKFI